MTKLHGHRSIEDLVQRTLERVRQGAGLLVKGTAVAGGIAIAAAGSGSVGCAGDETGTPTAGVDLNIPIPGEEAKSDWAQYEGKRNVDMVQYMGDHWHNYYDCGNRGGCMGIDVFVKVKVRRVDDANLASKRVGVVYRELYSDPGTALGTYFADLGDGLEEWHVKVNRRSWEPGHLVFNVWYQDGKGNTYYDDNAGEFHAAAYSGNYSVIMHNWSQTKVTVDQNGVSGKISLYLADLDYDKQLVMVWTLDNWATVNNFAIGAADQTNAWHYVNEAWNGYETWECNLDIKQPLAADAQLQYAIVYKHGVVNDAKVYEFWDNNSGSNYTIRQGGSSGWY